MPEGARLSQEERQRLLVEWNETGIDRVGCCLHEQFEAQTDRTPDAVALVFEDQQLTYRELDRRANRLANFLRTLGVRPDVLVGICVERSLEMLVALLGVLKAGGAYVPLDPSYPPERRDFMLKDSAAPVLVTTHALVASGVAVHGSTVCLDRDWARISDESDARLAAIGAEHLAYMIYTSGSTGRPKGVMVPHRAVANLLSAMAKDPGLGPEDVVAALASLSFDMSVVDIWLPLVTGATLVVVARQEASDGKRLRARLRACKATVLEATPSTFRLLLDVGWPTELPLRVLVGGEAVPEALATALTLNAAASWNMYGPTETTVWSTKYRLGAPDPGAPPIGRPLDNTTVYVLDQHMAPLPVGAEGELHIGGLGLARGYHRRPGLTADRFVPDPFGRAGGRLYRTGDLVKWRSDGVLEYVGRLDHQVKMRGFRIELGEIESVLGHRGDVKEAVVVVREDSPGDQRLVAYLVGTTAAHPKVPELRSFLGTTLPDYMVPSAFVWLDAMPLTPNGKVNRAALPTPGNVLDVGRAPPAVDHASRTPEDVLAGIWSKLLQVERVGPDDNFFYLGGHSLLAMQLISQVQEQFGVEIPVQQLFEAPTLAGLAQKIVAAHGAADGAAVDPATSFAEHQHFPASHVQERERLLQELGIQSIVIEVMHLRGTLDTQLFARAFNQLVQRHQALRTTLHVDGQRLSQVVVARTDVTIEQIDLRGLEAGHRDAHLRQLIDEHARRKRDPATWPAFAVVQARMAAEHHVLILLLPHMIVDGWSIGILWRDLTELYSALVDGREPVLPAIRGEYVHHTLRQHELLASTARAERVSYWRRQVAELAAPLELPIAHARRAVPSRRGGWIVVQLEPTLADGVRKLAREQASTVFCVLMGGFQVLLNRYSGRSPIAVGAPIDNRDNSRFHDTVGCFADLMPFVLDLADQPSFVTVIARVMAAHVGGSRHALPFDVLVAEVAPPARGRRDPIFQVVFTFDNAEAIPLTFPGCSVEREMFDLGEARSELMLWLGDRPGGIGGFLEYSADLYDRAVAQQLVDHFLALLEGAVADPTLPVDEIPIDHLEPDLGIA